ncbi:MAG TPA: molybdopterin cofactor-binding domain-containing protein, partial [Myxococcaceae bacterium]|nr:molybdopterin cofactor-binding domain-containing protein [Myxococcaceae bacterium]
MSPVDRPRTGASHPSRREFLKASATVAGGLTLGLYLPPAAGAAEVRGVKAGEPFSPNAWITVGADGSVLLSVDKSDMGQGAQTGMAMILADELEADWRSVRVGPVPSNPAAWPRRMSTGGSTSVRGSYDALRSAGAAAREMLVAAAAQTWAVDASSCRAEQGHVIHTASGRKLPYGKLVAQARRLPVPKEPGLKDPKEFRYIGKSLKRLDLPPKVDGSAKYGIDVRVPGMLFASVERAPAFGGTVKRVDDSKARAVKGVTHVLRVDGTANTAGAAGKWRNYFPSSVAVLGHTTWQALSGRRALEVEWDDGPAASLSSASLRTRFAEAAAQAGAVARSEGDARAALASAAKKIEAVYELPFLHHAPMEPMNCTAHVRPDGCDVWVPTQSQTNAQEIAAELTGLPKEKVRIHTTLLGGGFGRRLEQDFVSEAVLLSKQSGRPVQVVWTREDDVRHSFYRPATYNALAAALDASGKPVAWSHHVVGPSILKFKYGSVEGGVDRTLVEGAKNVPYAFPNLLVQQTIVETPVPLGFWRSVGSSHNAFVTEAFFDEIARAARRDPYELRRQMLAPHPRHLAALDLAADKAGWGKPLPEGRFRGIAVAESFGSFVAEVAEISLETDGRPRVHRVVAAVECGPCINPE